MLFRSNQELMDTCRAEIEDLLKKGIIRKSRSPWSCPAFYIQKNAEIERGVPRLVINYKPLDKVLEWVRYPIPNKKDLVNRLSRAVIFSKFDMKSGLWQIQIRKPDRYKAAFTTPFGTIKLNDLVVSAPKIKLFQTKVHFLGFDIHHGVIKPIDRAIQFADKFPDEILDKTQLQKFLGSLNYISDLYQNLRQQCKLLFDKLRTNPSPWTPAHTTVVRHIKQYVKFEFIRSSAPWKIKSLHKASIAKTLSTLTAYNQAQNLDSAKSIDCPINHNQLSCINYKYNCISASISFKEKRIFNQPLKILFHSKFSWQEKTTMS